MNTTKTKYTQALECDLLYKNIDRAKILALKNFLSQFSFDKQLNEQLEAAYLLNHTGELDAADAYLKKYYPDGNKNNQAKYFPNTKIETVDIDVLSERFYECNDPVPVMFVQSLKVGFFDKKKNAVFVSTFSEINPIWRPTTTIEPKVERRMKCEQDKYVGKFFKTTSKHKFHSGFIGVLDFNDPVLPTTIGGRVSPLQPKDIGRYIMRWVNWTQQQRKIEEIVSVDELLAEGIIDHAEPDEKQHLNRPSEPHPEWVTEVKTRVRSRPPNDISLKRENVVVQPAKEIITEEKKEKAS